MENLVKLLILSLIQGLTEFLPVSSSGHLVLFTDILKFNEAQLAWTVAFHAGTFISIVVYFWKDLKKILFSFLPFDTSDREEKQQYQWLVFLIILGSLPAAIIGITFYGFFERLFRNVPLVALALFINGCWLIFAEQISRRKQAKLDLKNLSWKQALLIGLAQTFALIPGISRSGATIGCGYLCGLKKDLAFSFAFLLALPVTLGALILSAGKIKCSLILFVTVIFFTALVGYIALKVLAQVVKKSRLKYFAFYCWGISLWMMFFIRA